MSEPTPLQIVLDEVRLVRRDLADYMRETATYSQARCEAHTDRINAVASKQTAYEAAIKALKEDRTERRADHSGGTADDSHRWQRYGVLAALAIGIAALLVPLFR